MASHDPATTSSSTLGSSIRAAWQDWDGLVRGEVFHRLRQLGFDEINTPSVITKDRAFTRSPTPLITAILAYLAIVCLGVVGIKAKRWFAGGAKKGGDPLVLKLLVQCHNLFLIVLSSYMCTTCVREALANGYVFWGNAYNETQVGMANVIHIFYLSKIYEFADTIVMLLKGNIHQVSFLHVYHHVSISLIWWAIALVAPGGDAWYSCSLNSFVHVLMYTYYFLASAIGKDEKRRKKYLWWGRYMTQFQMFQFVTMMFQAYYCYHYSPYNKFLSGLLFWYMQTLLVLFVNFYVKKYFGLGVQKGKAKAA